MRCSQQICITISNQHNYISFERCEVQEGQKGEEYFFERHPFTIHSSVWYIPK
jgi:hypothetical protein